ncbi:MAG: pilus assembly protein PilM, partial [Thermodesulfovibrionia bacterium]|nr:pilus assembly protein PilM [Thermodesulfovibrionia bacterium]
IGASTININILKGGVSVFTRDSSVGGNILSEALQREFTVSYDNAERLKFGETIEGVSQEDVASVLMSASEDIVGEISRSFDFFKSTSKMGEEINEIILCGGSALVKDFVPLLTERIGISAKIVEPFKNIQVPDTIDKGYLMKIGPIVAVAAGLALRRIGDR